MNLIKGDRIIICNKFNNENFGKQKTESQLRNLVFASPFSKNLIRNSQSVILVFDYVTRPDFRIVIQ